ncbi:MAG: hypothetical protein J6T16_06045, partial [Opitutales bacterium]|nr:hypothetical protein [Opitutales bacterium]
MKKLISYIMLAAASALFFACSPKSTPAITIEDAANAAPENTDIFLALEISKKLINEDLAQKGAKEFTTAFIENPEMQKFLDLAFQPLPEGLKSKISAKAVADFANEAMQKPEDIFFAMAATDLKEGCCDIKFIALNNSLCVKKIREILEQEKDIEKLRKGDIDFFKIKGETPAAVAVQNALLVVADDEAAAVKVIESLKSKKNGAFAATEKFRKLMSLEKDPIIVAAVNFKNISENSVGNMFFAYSAENANKGSGAAKFELGEKAFAGGNDAKIWGAFCKSKLEKASLLKNSMGNATFAMAAAVPEITADIESE